MSWDLQSFLWAFLPEDRSVSLTLVLFSAALALIFALFLIGAIRKKRWIVRVAIVPTVIALTFWGALFSFRPIWLRVAINPATNNVCYAAYRIHRC